MPTQPRRFIRRFAELFEAGLGFVWLVFDDERPIAAAVFLTYNGTATYKYSASDAASLAKRPNNLLLPEAIRWSCEAGLRSFDFGRTDIENVGLRKFKRSWGAEEQELSYTYVAEREPRQAAAPSLRERVLGATIRNSPPFVGRVVGGALYGHFG